MERRWFEPFKSHAFHGVNFGISFIL